MFGFKKKSNKPENTVAIYSEIIKSQSQIPDSVRKLDAQTERMITSVSKMLVTKR